MSQFVEKTIQFNEIATGKSHSEFDSRRVALYYGLIFEELAEAVAALPETEETFRMKVMINHWSKCFKQGDYDELTKQVDRETALDAAVDIAVVAIGSAHSLGADVVGACEHVADSNLSKFVQDSDGNLYALRDANGKVQKGPNYFRPDLARFLLNNSKGG